AYLKELEKRFSELGKEAIQKIEQEGLQPQDLSYGDKGIYQLFNHAANNDLSNIFSKDYKNAQKTLDEGKWEPAKATKKLSENLKHCLKQLGYSALELREKEKERYILAQELKKHLYQLATIHELQKSLQKVKDTENKIHISELNHKINEVIATEPIPFIFEKLGIRYHHILIDEFQDTSEKQWHNLLPLVINALNKQCATLVVGDAKQAIYRWRGGRADMLVDLPNVPTLPPDNVQLQQDVAVLQYEKNIQTLTVNRRSRANIIQFNNAFYEYVRQQYAAQHPDLLRYYAEVTQATTDKQGGQIDIVIFSEEVEDEQAITFEKILDYMAQLEQLGYQRSDIAILVRRNSDGFELAKAFMTAGISVVSSEVLRLLSAPTVAFIVNFFRLIAGSKDQKVAMQVASYVIQEKINLERQGEFLIKAAQAMAVSVEALVDFINQHVGTHFQLDGMRFLSLYEMAEELIRQLNLYEKHNEQMYIHKLLDEIQRFVNKKGNHLLDFLDYLDQHAEEISITSPASPEAIQLMTIHKAKGLQFPVVILPFAEWLLKPTHWTKIWKKVPDSQKKLNFGLNAAILTTTEKLQETLFKDAYAEELHAHFLEALNILYVATTRAEERIFILGKTSKKGSGTLMLIENFLNQNALPTKILQTNALYRHFRLFEDYSAPLRSPLVAKKDEELMLTSFLHTESRNFIRLKQNSLRNEDLMHHLSNFLSPLRQGLLMHYAFENVHYVEDISIAVQKLVSEGYITLQESGNLIEKMQRVVDIPLIRPYFEPKEGRNVLNERFVLNGAETYRPDRLVIDRFADKKEVVIIDYKTGVYEKKYELQLNHYAQLLNSMGYLVRKKILVFTEIPDAFEV
ncbi:MAG: UvrD-helicase domain-containing protein, partial [Flammeovirgaceae bacterium]|nr:UvrD-helicase domain-containing protein [Flammeovirgaceae bacterium]MDW8286787.1 3'-5' exonuclease [Flammeovirgaceae bacterium]